MNRIGWAVLSAVVWISEGAAAQTPDSLTARDTVKAAEITISAKRSPIPGFDERRIRGGGYALDRQELERQQGRKLSDILTRVAGLRVLRGVSNQAWVAASRGAGSLRSPRLDRWDERRGARPACYSDVYLDAVLVYASGGAQSLFDINSVSPSQLEAIEYFPGGASIPVEFNKTGSACGVLLIWTRR